MNADFVMGHAAFHPHATPLPEFGKRKRPFAKVKRAKKTSPRRRFRRAQ